LKVAKKAAGILRDKLSCDTILTRNNDVFVPLEERTAIANASNADLFISIHVNAAPSPDISRVETFILSLATNKDEMRTAAFENATSSRSLSDLQAILMDLMQNTKINESTKLAEYIQEDMISGLSRKYGGITNHGVKKAPFIVLIGAQMPAILTEIAFLSNPKEAKRLQSDAYLHTVAEEIANGISRYIADLNMARFDL
ncbi:MAG: N-acetylmuramoyl-L-alanine amidase, partial [Desulfobulbaceae bacterium]|nr:N-acetylmuramoyl-L-alanine amidase [Desulfobulbaceae bacterium]